MPKKTTSEVIVMAISLKKYDTIYFIDLNKRLIID
tara:strand:+ start:1302 stop:1406 length:105 start_codon:yes stop_codon:yes gene_type:complete